MHLHIAMELYTYWVEDLSKESVTARDPEKKLGTLYF